MSSAGRPSIGLRDAVLWLLAAQLASVSWIVLIAAAWFGGAIPEEPAVWVLVIGTIPLWICYGLGPILTARSKGIDPVAGLGLEMKWSDVLIGAFAGLVTQLVILPVLYIPIARLTDEDPSAVAEDLVNRVDGPLDVIGLIVLVSVMAPLVEELYFRGLLQRALVPHVGIWPAVGIQAVVFAAVHFQLLQFPGLLVVGLFAGTLAGVTRRLGGAWVMHMVFNTTTLILLLS